MAYLDAKSLDEVNRMTLSEYFYRMYALEYKMLNDIKDTYDLAFAIRNVQATENIGTEKKPEEAYIYKNITDIIDVQENLKRLDKGESIQFKGDKDIKPQQNKDLKAMLQRLAKTNS